MDTIIINYWCIYECNLFVATYLAFQLAFYRVGFRQGLVQGEKIVIHPILDWLLRNIEDLKKRAYLARFLVKVEIPVEILGDAEIASAYEQVSTVVML